MLTFRHSGHLGDIIYSLPLVKAACEKFATKALFQIKKGSLIPTDYDVDGPRPAMTDASYDFIRPLLEQQPYIDRITDDPREIGFKRIDFDLDDFRKLPVNPRLGHLPLYYMQRFRIYCDYAEPWLTVAEKDLDPSLNDKIIVGRSPRNINPALSYKIPEACFIGLDSEFEAMKSHIGNLQRLPVANAYEAACHIASCKLFIGNSSFNFAVAEGLKKNRIFEVTKTQSLMPCRNVKYFIDQRLEDLIR